MNQEFWFKNTDEIRNYFLEEINQNELISKKHIKVCTTLTHITYFIVSTTIASTNTGCYVLLEVWKKYRSYKSKSCKEKKRRIMLLSKWAVSDRTKSKFIKE